VAFVGVSRNDTVAAGQAFQREFSVPYPLANDRSGRIWAVWGVAYQPATVLLDKRGRMAKRVQGEIDHKALAADLAYLTTEPA
jgi:peroxiredoxin